MVLPKQTNALIDYLESHRDLALGHLSKSREGREQSRKLWNELALILNTKGPNPVLKTGDEWRLYYNEFKYKCLRKIKSIKEEHNGTGPATKHILLTPCQDRLYKLLGRDGHDPLPCVKTDPLFNEKTLPESQCDEDIIEVKTSPPLSPTASSPPPLSPPLETAQERLQRMQAEAIMAQARATDRLAAAIERGIKRLNQPVVIVLQTPIKKPKRRRRSVETSGSESE